MIDETRTLACILALADITRRRAASEALARHLDAEALFVFVHDPEVAALVPAPGFAQTYPGGPAWRAFLAACERPGPHQGEVAHPDGQTLRRAMAFSAPEGTTWVFIGRTPVLAPVELDALGVVGALFRAEHAAVVANGAAMAAREAVQHASAVTAALDAARGELQRAAERERAARDEAERANRAKDEFLAMLGHELRNPLAPIVTALSLLKLRGLAGTPENEVIERQLGHLVRLVDDLLDVSRITRGLVRLERRPVELAAVIAKAVEMASPLLERQRHRFSVSVASNGMMLDADEGRLAQVMSNLLTNAARYTPAGGDISLTAVNTDGVVEIRVKDSGMGIDPEILPKIFDLFFQGKRSSDRADGGLGLGLALARNLVAMHGGTIEARSAGRGRGSEFVVRLPAAPAERRTEPAPVAPARVERTGAPRRVLVVDDNKDAAELLAEFLRTEGHDVAIAGDGAEALQIFDGYVPDCAVLDIGLPVMDGFALARAVRAHPGGGRTRLIAVTGYGQSDDRVRSRDSGFDAHLVKPVDLAELVAELAKGPHAVAPADPPR